MGTVIPQGFEIYRHQRGQKYLEYLTDSCQFLIFPLSDLYIYQCVKYPPNIICLSMNPSSLSLMYDKKSSCSTFTNTNSVLQNFKCINKNLPLLSEISSIILKSLLFGNIVQTPLPDEVP